jgi:hypothetical protein
MEDSEAYIGVVLASGINIVILGIMIVNSAGADRSSLFRI